MAPVASLPIATRPNAVCVLEEDRFARLVARIFIDISFPLFRFPIDLR
jgi:hypothetical protein